MPDSILRLSIFRVHWCCCYLSFIGNCDSPLFIDKEGFVRSQRRERFSAWVWLGCKVLVDLSGFVRGKLLIVEVEGDLLLSPSFAKEFFYHFFFSSMYEGNGDSALIENSFISVFDVLRQLFV